MVPEEEKGKEETSTPYRTKRGKEKNLRVLNLTLHH